MAGAVGECFEGASEGKKILNNNTKDLDFFSKNRIIYAFQKNIVKNNKNSTYFKWFDFASKSKNQNNVESDFSQYKEDKIMAEIINRLRKDKLPPEEFKYVSDMPQWEFWALNEVRKAEEKLTKKLTKKLVKEFEQEKQKVEQEIQKVEQEKQKVEQEKQKTDAMLLKSIKLLLNQGQKIEDIALALEISTGEILKILEIN